MRERSGSPVRGSSNASWSGGGAGGMQRQRCTAATSAGTANSSCMVAPLSPCIPYLEHKRSLIVMPKTALQLLLVDFENRISLCTCRYSTPPTIGKSKLSSVGKRRRLPPPLLRRDGGERMDCVLSRFIYPWLCLFVGWVVLKLRRQLLHLCR